MRHSVQGRPRNGSSVCRIEPQEVDQKPDEQKEERTKVRRRKLVTICRCQRAIAIRMGMLYSLDNRSARR